MKSFDSMLENLKTALLTVSENVGHYQAIDGTTTHIVYAEDNEASEVAADNKKQQQAIEGTIDLYALKKDVTMADDVQSALQEAGVGYSLNSVSCETDTPYGFIHFEWIFEVA